jgi:hypothetical protein
MMSITFVATDAASIQIILRLPQGTPIVPAKKAKLSQPIIRLLTVAQHVELSIALSLVQLSAPSVERRLKQDIIGASASAHKKKPPAA